MNRKNAVPKSNGIQVFLLLLLLFLAVWSCSLRSSQVKRAEILYKEGQRLSSQGQYDKAIKKFDESINVARKAKFKQGIAHSLYEKALIQVARGEYEQARNNLMEALVIYRELGMNSDVSKTLNDIALIYIQEHKFSDAINKYQELIDWDKETGNEVGVAITLNNLGNVYEKYLRMPIQAKEKYIEALKIFEKIGNEKYATLMKRKILRINTFLDKP